MSFINRRIFNFMNSWIWWIFGLFQFSWFLSNFDWRSVSQPDSRRIKKPSGFQHFGLKNFCYLVDFHLRRQTRLLLLPVAPEPDPALVELLFASSSSRAVFKSWTNASILILFPNFFWLLGDGGSDATIWQVFLVWFNDELKSRLKSWTIFGSIVWLSFFRRTNWRIFLWGWRFRAAGFPFPLITLKCLR